MTFAKELSGALVDPIIQTQYYHKNTFYAVPKMFIYGDRGTIFLTWKSDRGQAVLTLVF